MNVFTNDTYSTPEKVDAKLKITLQRDQRNNKYIKTLPFEYIKQLVDLSLSFKEGKRPQGFENPVKSIAKLKYIILKRNFPYSEASSLLIKIRDLQALEKISMTRLDKEVKRLYKKYAAPMKLRKAEQRKTKKAARQARLKSYSALVKGAELNSNYSSGSSKSSWSPNYERSPSASNNDDVVIIHKTMRMKRSKNKTRSRPSYDSD